LVSVFKKAGLLFETPYEPLVPRTSKISHHDKRLSMHPIASLEFPISNLGHAQLSVRHIR
jgi:hypothetical protein